MQRPVDLGIEPRDDRLGYSGRKHHAAPDHDLEPGHGLRNTCYKIQIDITAPNLPSDLQDALQFAYDDGAAGFFQFEHISDNAVRITFERDIGEDADYIDDMVAKGLSYEAAACEQLARELKEFGEGSLNEVVAALRSGPRRVEGLENKPMADTTSKPAARAPSRSPGM